ncbi:MAG TPA: hypothetical protein VEH49_00060 [Methylomirabilota bacterium]|nr:hypothetical protein [Methylomirabilota bacterium]
MYWGSGPSLGLLTVLGYLLFVLGAAVLWRQRGFLNLWARDEYGALRRGLARHAVPGAGFSLREDARFKLVPGGFLPALEPARRVRIHRAALLLLTGPILFLLDFFV